jgi:hypothetical protein
MARGFPVLIFRAKAVLCTCLVMSLHAGAGGCGTNVGPLSPEHPVAAGLAGTPFAGASGVSVNPVRRDFRVIYPDGFTPLAGAYAFDESGQLYVAALTVVIQGSAFTLRLDSSNRITEIVAGPGLAWQRAPAVSAPQAPRAPSAPTARAAASVDDYVAANAEIMAAAEALDQEGASGLKAEDSAHHTLLMRVLATLALTGGAGVGPTLLVAFHTLLVLRVFLESL